MKTEFIITIEDKPGQLADLGEALGDADINIEAMMAITSGGFGSVRLIVDDEEKAVAMLDKSGLSYKTRRVIAVNLLDQPGTMGDVARVMSDAGINIDTAYVTIGGMVIMGVDDLMGAIQITNGMDVRGDQ